MATANLTDLVQLSQIETHFHDGYVQHLFGYVSGRRKVRKEEKWAPEKKLGQGAFGVVTLERCIEGDRKDDLRAVKRVPKSEHNDYFKELEAVALFSHSKVSGLLVFARHLCSYRT